MAPAGTAGRHNFGPENRDDAREWRRASPPRVPPDPQCAQAPTFSSNGGCCRQRGIWTSVLPAGLDLLVVQIVVGPRRLRSGPRVGLCALVFRLTLFDPGRPLVLRPVPSRDGDYSTSGERFSLRRFKKLITWNQKIFYALTALGPGRIAGPFDDNLNTRNCNARDCKLYFAWGCFVAKSARGSPKAAASPSGRRSIRRGRAAP